MLNLRPRGHGFEPHRHHCVVSLSKTVNPSLVLVQPSKPCHYITERLLIGHKKSNQIKQTKQYGMRAQPPLTLSPLGNFSCFFLSSADFFQNQLFRKILSGIPSECQTDLIQIRPNILSGLIWVQSVCKGYQQTTLVGKELNAYVDVSRGARGLIFCHVDVCILCLFLWVPWVGL